MRTLSVRNGEPASADSASVTSNLKHTTGPGLPGRNSTLNTSVSGGPNSTPFTFTGQPPERQCYQVRAVNAKGASDWTPVSPTGECV